MLIWHSRKFQILSVFKSDVPPKKFCGNCATFFQDSLTNRNNKKHLSMSMERHEGKVNNVNNAILGLTYPLNEP